MAQRVTYNVEAKELRHVRYSPRHKAKALVYSVMSSMMVQAEKQMQAGNVTEEGIHFATLSASKTAASILTKTVEHHLHEAQQEADVAEAYEYRDSIKADIKAWAFQVCIIGKVACRGMVQCAFIPRQAHAIPSIQVLRPIIQAQRLQIPYAAYRVEQGGVCATC